MTVVVEIPEELQARLLSEAEASGVPVTQLVQDCLRDHYEEAEDLRVAEARLDAPRSPITPAELRNRLGLDD